MTYWCGAKLRRVAGWVAGGCWDDDMKLVMTGIIPENSIYSTSKMMPGEVTIGESAEVFHCLTQRRFE